MMMDSRRNLDTKDFMLADARLFVVMSGVFSATQSCMFERVTRIQSLRWTSTRC
jgi:hypothetical protein